MAQFTAGSLFSGIGGMDLAFSLAGFDIRWQVEIDDFCRKVLAKHSREYWHNATQFTDVRHVTARTGKGWRGYQQLERVDVLFGGFPCQDISIAGKRSGIREGTRSGLWGEFRRLIGEIRPRAVLLENVPNIVHIGGASVIADLAALGYDAKWGVISAQDAGAPHVRKRWWCVAVENASCQRIAENNGITTGSKSQFADWANDENEMAHTISTGFQERNTPRTPDKPRLNSGSVATLGHIPLKCEIKSGMGGIADGLPARMDGTRLMTQPFPAPPNQPQREWEAPRVAPKGNYGNARIKALGNAVVPQVVYPIALELYRLLSAD